MFSWQAETLAWSRTCSVAVVPECGARRRHKGRVRTLESRDGEQRDQRDSGDEFLHDTSPSLLKLFCLLQQQQGEWPYALQSPRRWVFGTIR